MTMLPHIASRVLDTPLVIGRARLEAILAVIGPRIGIAAPATGVPDIPGLEGLPARAVMNGDGRRRGAWLVTPEGIAVIPVFGTLVKRAGAVEAASGLTSYGHLENRIMDAATDPAVRAILLDIDSPGGEAAGVFDLSDLVFEARSLKPVWAVADEEAFSGAYAIASAAERLIVPRTGGVGSIGVLALHVDRSARDALEGFRTTTVHAGAHKADFIPHETLKDGARKTLQAEVDRVHALFVETVARNRAMTADAVRATEAGLFFGVDAVRAGLADEVGTLRETLGALAASLAQPRSIAAAPAALAGPALFKPATGKDHAMNDDTTTDTARTGGAAPPTSVANSSQLNAATSVAQPAPAMAEPAPPTAEPAPPTAEPVPAPAVEPEKQTADVVDLDKVRAQARGEAAAEAAAEAGLIAELCALAGMPERTAGMLAKGLSADVVRRELLTLKAGRDDAEVRSHLLPGAGTGGPASLDDNPVVRAATARAAAAKEV